MNINIDFKKYPHKCNIQEGSITESVNNWLNAINYLNNTSGKKEQFGEIATSADGLTVYNGNENKLQFYPANSDERTNMTTWLESQLSLHSVREYNEENGESNAQKGARFEEETANEFLEKKYLVLKNLVLIPPPDPSREVMVEVEDDENTEEWTFANQIDILAWDGDCLWIVECKNSVDKVITKNFDKMVLPQNLCGI